MTATHPLHRPVPFIAVCLSLAVALALVATLAVWAIVGGATASALQGSERTISSDPVSAVSAAAPSTTATTSGSAQTTATTSGSTAATASTGTHDGAAAHAR
ncbi:hypothetical protein [Leucobacter massiliensis]|uniref:Uncharacterized protein n=1 Tax=Leucobacter massiliensis TaxID=1686285 RepID=A0A2S9QKD6_9MICO|nr:hypothetical protein [Leucobacter massiliensis]PRI10042.1 hypothetical protein B4915_14065 [Leucobacter massiliensis]PRI10045.1 hypothetical protein B4915_14090 [Leucobacter massiliensis]